MRIDLALVCDYALIDQFGKLSMLGVFENLWIPQFPAVHPRVHLVVRLKGKRTEIGDHTIRIRFVSDEGKEIINGDGVVTFNEPPAGITEIESGTVLVFDLPLEKVGKYQFEVLVDQDLNATVPITVSQSPVNSPAPEAGG